MARPATLNAKRAIAVRRNRGRLPPLHLERKKQDVAWPWFLALITGAQKTTGESFDAPGRGGGGGLMREVKGREDQNKTTVFKV